MIGDGDEVEMMVGGGEMIGDGDGDEEMMVGGGEMIGDNDNDNNRNGEVIGFMDEYEIERNDIKKNFNNLNNKDDGDEVEMMAGGGEMIDDSDEVEMMVGGGEMIGDGDEVEMMIGGGEMID